MEVVVNYLAVVLAAVAVMAVGALWYGPFFGKEWMRLTGHKPDPAKRKEMGKLYALQLVGTIVMAYVMTYSMAFAGAYLKTSGVSNGVMAGFWNWLGFIAPVSLGVVLWEGKPWKLWCINAGYWLASLVVMGAVLGAMQA